MYSPTGGEARIDGHSINSDMIEARRSLGLCPQHNMLFSDLTVYEHFMIFSMVSLNQCDQIGRFIALWTTFKNLWQRLICTNLPHS